MNSVAKFLLRAALSAVLAYVIGHVFWKTADKVWMVLLAIFFLAMGYLSEWMRNRRDDDG